MTSYWWILILILLAAAAVAVAVRRRRFGSDGTALEAYIQGLRSMIAGDRKTAFVKFRQAVEKDTENIDAYLKMGDLFRDKGMVDKALQIHRELTLRRKIPPELQSEINQSLAMDYIEAATTDKAGEILQQMIKDGDQRSWAEDRLLEIYLKNKSWGDAEDLYRGIMKKRGLKDGSTMANIRIMVGRELHERKLYHKARLAYKEAISLYKNNPFPYLYIAESYVEENRVEDGLEFLKKLCENAPRYAYLGFPLVEETFFNLGRFSEVEDIYHGVLHSDPSNIPARIALAGILEKKGETATAENLLRSVLDSEMANPAAAMRLAKLLASTNRGEEGLEILSRMADKADLLYESLNCNRCGKTVQKPLPSCPRCGGLGTFV
jgi:lipopolysaccharide biosynthesis regulator YciM